MSSEDKLEPMLCVDYGLIRVGLAMCDPNCRVAVGAGRIEGLSGRALARAVFAEARSRGLNQVLIGSPPVGANNVEPVIEGADRLGEALQKRGMIIRRWDESYTTAAALAAQRQVGGKSKPRNEWIDQAAAILILQSYLDSINNNEDSEIADSD